MKLRPFTVFTLFVASCGGSQASSPVPEPTLATTQTTSTVVLSSEVDWQDLNPARGDQSPKAATLWGDRNGSGPTGFLLNPVDGFRSPPHIHNVSYRGVVIRGLIHNADPSAQDMWMPTGSFWTQPKGDVHITAAQGSEVLAYIEIEEGPYLVRPVEKAFESNEVPINVDAANIEWTTPAGAPAIELGIRLAHLWGDTTSEEARGTLIKIPTGQAAEVRSKARTFRGVLIDGALQYTDPSKEALHSLEPGSYFSSTGASIHSFSCNSETDCIIYVRAEGGFELTTRPS